MRRTSLLTHSLTRPRLSIIILCAALSSFWIGLGLTTQKTLSQLTHNWNQRLTNTSLIIIPSNNISKIQALTHTLELIHGVSNLHQLSPSDTSRILSRWGASWPRQAPNIILFHNNGNSEFLKETVKKIIPDALFVPPYNQGISITPYTVRTINFGKNISITFTLSGVLIFVLFIFIFIKNNYTLQKSQINILYLLGAPPYRIYKNIIFLFSLLYFFGGVIGILFLLPVINILTATTAPLFHQYLPETYSLLPMNLVSTTNTLYLIPIVQALLGFGGSWIFYHKIFRTML